MIKTVSSDYFTGKLNHDFQTRAELTCEQCIVPKSFLAYKNPPTFREPFPTRAYA